MLLKNIFAAMWMSRTKLQLYIPQHIQYPTGSLIDPQILYIFFCRPCPSCQVFAVMTNQGVSSSTLRTSQPVGPMPQSAFLRQDWEGQLHACSLSHGSGLQSKWDHRVKPSFFLRNECCSGYPCKLNGTK